jgi:hypothetical protein
MSELEPACPQPASCFSSEERWADLLDFPDYQASDQGRIRSRKSGEWKVLRPTAHSKTGYLVVSLRVMGRYVARSVHRLVAAAFLGAAHGRDVNHKNGNKHDNALHNLEYLSRGDNHRHAYRTRLREPVGRRLTDLQVREIVSLRGVVPQAVVARRFGVSRAAVSLIQNGKRHAVILNHRRQTWRR